MDQAAYELIDKARYVNPEVAVSWATSITDSKLRRRSLERIALSWGKRDMAALQQFIDQTDEISAHQKEIMRISAINQSGLKKNR